MPPIYFIYALSDPRTKAVLYIGRSRNLKERLKGHMQRQRTEEMRAWIADLKAAGLKASIAAIEECNTQRDADEREIFWIAEYRKAGPLLNRGNGGNGVGKHSAETKAKISGSNKVAKSQPEFRRAASARMKLRRNSPAFAALVRKVLSKEVLQVCVKTGKVLAKFPSITCAAAATGCHMGQLAKAIARGRASVGFRWLFASAAMQARCAAWVPPDQCAAKHAAALSEAHRKPVLQLSLSGDRVIREFPYAPAAALAVGVKKSAIYKAIKSQGTCAGFRWKYSKKT